MNLDELKELLELISAKDVTEFELEEQGVKLKIKKGASLPGNPGADNHHSVVALPQGALASEDASSTGSSSTTDGEEPGLMMVLSPMVGTFYRSPEPGAAPFVSEGERVKVGQVLCIIEAMKLMNEIESEYEGEVARVYVDNGQPVQYGDQLFAIRGGG
ncbi:MAG: acetyl-CoA carboxylase biotin carboxyl carrier protein [Acidobacteriota bacterium]